MYFIFINSKKNLTYFSTREDIFVIICKTLIQTQKYQEQRLLAAKTQDHEYADQIAQVARQKAKEDRGFFGNIGMWWTGERDALRAEARKKTQISAEARDAKNTQALKLQNIANLITEISKEGLSERTKTII